MKIGMHRDTGDIITGLPYLKQRFDDVMRTYKGQVVCARGYGGNLVDEVDRNSDPTWFMRVYMMVAEAVSNVGHGLDDFELSIIRIVTIENDRVEIECDGTYLGTELVTLGTTI
ncbi:hypothetical protein QF117_10645 [Vibrio sp. YMD68]|uniref:hypothetical protein n=1 Tax=Vibrio sp. YMD68 TaxID=3042300 RepID=UPI00249B949B|nr:hypothetical protein [Vibrio sp. YMD68]WGV98825.1 hypothetical protein QF117_02365 [Vibrio sp. YMD68]WGW01248.1 hypothetical protein QF117_10645 [Vibrio sp. YMD68]